MLGYVPAEFVPGEIVRLVVLPERTVSDPQFGGMLEHVGSVDRAGAGGDPESCRQYQSANGLDRSFLKTKVCRPYLSKHCRQPYDQVPQKKAAMVEEANAASVTLAIESAKLCDLIAAFTLPGSSAKPSPARYLSFATASRNFRLEHLVLETLRSLMTGTSFRPRAGESRSVLGDARATDDRIAAPS
jgi:hypothetical protein